MSDVDPFEALSAASAGAAAGYSVGRAGYLNMPVLAVWLVDSSTGVVLQKLITAPLVTGQTSRTPS
jgi:hypothetical protein